MARSGWTDDRVEQIIGNLLRAGVILATLVVLTGGVIYVIRNGTTHYSYEVFRGEPAHLRILSGIVDGVLAGSGRAMIQLGLVLLLATPVARVAFSLFAFQRQRDWTYVAITAVVLAVLLYSIIGG